MNKAYQKRGQNGLVRERFSLMVDSNTRTTRAANTVATGGKGSWHFV